MHNVRFKAQGQTKEVPLFVPVGVGYYGRLGVTPKECLYLGDTNNTDMDTGKAFTGMFTIGVTWGSFRKELEELISII